MRSITNCFMLSVIDSGTQLLSNWSTNGLNCSGEKTVLIKSMNWL